MDKITIDELRDMPVLIASRHYDVVLFWADVPHGEIPDFHAGNCGSDWRCPREEFEGSFVLVTLEPKGGAN